MTDLSVTTNQEPDAELVKTRLIETKRDLGRSSVQLAGLLKLVRDEKLYLKWDHPSFNSAIEDPEIGISRSTAYGLIQVWETWIEKYKLEPTKVAEVPYDKLLLISPLVTDNNWDEMFHNAKSLSRQDLHSLRAEQGKATKKLMRCKVCKRWKLTIEDICQEHE